jgi:hypothetical protein
VLPQAMGERSVSAWATVLLAMVLVVRAGDSSHAAAPDPDAEGLAKPTPAARLAELELVAQAALALPHNVEGLPAEARVADLVWGGTTGNVEIVLASDLAALIGAPPTARPGLSMGAHWLLEAKRRIRGEPSPNSTEWSEPDDARAPELAMRLRYVIVLFEDHFSDPLHFGLEPAPPRGSVMAFGGRVALYALDGARLLAAKRLDLSVAVQPAGSGPLDSPYLMTLRPLEREARSQLAAMVGTAGGPMYGPLMELAPTTQAVSFDAIQIAVLVLMGFGLLMFALVRFGRRRHRERHDMDGVQVDIATRGDDARVLIEVTAALGVDLTWSAKPREGDVPSGDEALPGPDVRVRGEPLPALYAALTGAPVWRAVLDLGGQVEGDKAQLVVALAHNIGLEARARKVAAYVRDLRRMGDGVKELSAILASEVASHATRARIAIALIRQAPDSKAARDAQERLGWADPLEPHLVACLTSESIALVTDACDALASLGTAASLPALEQVYGPARTAATRAITAITTRGGDPRQGGLALASGPAGALSIGPDD